MSITLSRFSVLALHGKFDIEIPVVDNKLILVGVNGLGKTTVVNLIYFLLTEQWGRLLETEFAAIEVEINNEQIRIDRDEIQGKSTSSVKFEKAMYRAATRLPMPSSAIRRILTHPAYEEALLAPPDLRRTLIRELARDVGLSAVSASRLLESIPHLDPSDLFSTRRDAPAISAFSTAIANSGNHQVIYLPTYRRIEQDLKAIFPNLDEDELGRLTSRGERASGLRKRGHVELVQFGMQDVEHRISEELQSIRERTRSQLTNLTASYLKDIITYRADSLETEFLLQLNDDLVASVLDRVEENTLSIEDKKEVRTSIERLRVEGSDASARDRYLAYFFSRLLEIYVSLSDSESSIRSLVETCNRYFERKYVHYDDASFTAEVLDADGAELSWKVLSSGEKQVASLFTHLILGRDADQTVIIDEPELSLSVPWQKRLLPDIVESKNCKLLIAVTHSPFIYKNDLDAYAIDLSRCISSTKTTTR